MAATIIINRATGVGPTLTAITSGNSRLSTSDAPTPGTSDPIPIPGAGTNFSFWMSTRLQCTVAPTGTVDNLRWYPDASNDFGTAVTLEVGTAAAYAQATGTQGTTGNELTSANYTGLAPADPAADNAFTYNVGSPLAVTGSTITTEEFGHYVALQMSVGNTAGPGTVSTETMTWKYDET